MHHLQRRIQDFVKGEASRDAEGIQGETPKASRGVRVGRGVPFSHRCRAWEGAVPPPQTILKFYSLKWYILVHFYTL